MKSKSPKWLIGYFGLVLCALGIVAGLIIKVDPFFHYHKPLSNTYYYLFANQRSQNDGIVKHFDYNALITGTSMTENFKTSEMDEIFGVNSIKVPFSGGSYKEVNDNLSTALEYNPNLTTIVRALDMYMFYEQKDLMRDDLGTYPTYLYDRNPFNDVKYLFNRQVVFDYAYPMVKNNDVEGFQPGITHFDQYSNWMTYYTFGIHTVCPNGIDLLEIGEPVHLTEEERETILGNIRQNVTSLAEEYPDVAYYYFFPPYSAIWWRSLASYGTIYKQIEAETVVIEEILQYDNIKLYSFNNRIDITADLNNYKDNLHYGAWINSLILRWMKDGRYLLTESNYQDYLQEELSLYTSYNYAQMAGQIDYENDYYAEALVRKELNGIEPLEFTEEQLQLCELNSASIVSNQYNGTAGVECHGSIQREAGNSIPVNDYLIHSEYIGCKLAVQDIKDYSYFVCYGKKVADHGQPYILLYDSSGNELLSFGMHYSTIDSEWHQYLFDISELTGEVTILLNGGYIDCTGSPESTLIFSGITLY